MKTLIARVDDLETHTETTCSSCEKYGQSVQRQNMQFFKKQDEA